jgi:archaemetzincin
MNFNYILPIGNISQELLNFIGSNIQKLFNAPYRLLDEINIPPNAYFRQRDQYKSDVIIKEVSLLSFENTNKIISIVDKDIFSQDYKYIFGEAESPGNISLISIKRLNPEYYGQKYNQDVFYDRVFKEVLHELGHNYNLSHCPDRNCVMYFSNTLADTDYKKTSYCSRCKNLLDIYNK